jgi:hypothetical protein
MPRHGLHARTAAVIPRPASHGRRVAAFRARASSGRRSLAGAFMRAPRPSLPVQRFGHGTRRGPSRRPAVTYIVLARCRRYQACGAHRVTVSSSRPTLLPRGRERTRTPPCYRWSPSSSPLRGRRDNEAGADWLASAPLAPPRSFTARRAAHCSSLLQPSSSDGAGRRNISTAWPCGDWRCGARRCGAAEREMQ